jgi:predicted RND superfamily exporter protein
VLTGAFLTHILSTFKPTQYLGILSALTMLGALAGDLFFLPGLLQIVRGKKEKK